MAYQSLKEKVQSVIEESLGAKVSMRNEFIGITKQVSSSEAIDRDFIDSYAVMLKELQELYANGKKLVLTVFSLEQSGEPNSSAKLSANHLRSELSSTDIVIHSYTCEAATGIRSKLNSSVLDGLAEETVSGLDVDIRIQK